MPEINVLESGKTLAVKNRELGWFVVPDDPAMILEYRDGTAWALLPTEMCQASVDKGWNADVGMIFEQGKPFSDAQRVSRLSSRMVETNGTFVHSR
jgi:hypothetical protein